MIKRTIGSILALAAATSLNAQVTFQRGNTLSQLINNLYGGNGIQLAVNTHDAHFGGANNFQSFSRSLQAALQSRSFFPVPSAVGLVSFRFNEATGTYERVEGSSGPILAERGSTSGKGNLNISATYTFADYESINGNDTTEIVLHHCTEPACLFGLTDPVFLHDTVHVDVHLRLKSQAVALSVVYGLSDRLDVGLVVPYIRNDLQVFTHGFIVVGAGSNPNFHHFDPTIETPDQYGTGTAVGIGDMLLRGKLRLRTKTGIDTAILSDLTLPTGDKENFLGSGHVKLRETFIMSKPVRHFTPHLNLGYEATFGETKLNAFDYRFGTEIAPTPHLTISSDVIGVVRPKATTLFRSAVLDQSLLGRSEVDLAVGGKQKIGNDRAVLLNLLLPMNSAGIRPKYVVTLGLQMTM